MELDNRQLATLVWSAITVVALLIAPRVRRAVLASMTSIFKAMASWKILAPLTVYFLYATSVVMLAARHELWHTGLLVETLIIIFFVGLPMLFNANNVRSGDQLVKKTARQTLGVTALIAFFIGLEPFPLIGELILLPAVAALVIFSVVANDSPEQKKAKKVLDSLLAIIGFWLAWRTVKITSAEWTSYEAVRSIEELLLSMLLPLSLLPMVYIFAMVIGYESLFTRLQFVTKNRKLPTYKKIAIVFRFNLRLGLLNDFSGIWQRGLTEVERFHETITFLQGFRRAVRMRDKKLRDYNQQIRDRAGSSGVDDHGLQLDRREFHESKRGFNFIAIYANGPVQKCTRPL
jgi:hypothetical protein